MNKIDYKACERLVSKLFQDAGFGVISLHEYTSATTPRIQYKERFYIQPDLILIKDGMFFFVDVKGKSGYNKRGYTGIDMPKYMEYINLSKQAGVNFLLAFVQIDDGVFIVDINKTPGQKWDGRLADGKIHDQWRDGSVTWHRSQLIEIEKYFSIKEKQLTLL